MDKDKLKRIVDQALEKGLSSLDMGTLTTSDEIVHVTLENIGKIDFDKPTVEGLYNQMIDYLDELDLDTQAFAELYLDLTMRLTVIYTKEHEFEESVKLLTKALRYVKYYSSKAYLIAEQEARIHLRMSQAFHVLNEHAKKKEAIRLAHKIIKECFVDENPHKPYALYVLIMTTLVDISNLTIKVEEYYNEVKEICDNNPDCLPEYANFLFAYGRFLLSREGKNKEGIESLCKSIEILNDFDDPASKTSIANAYAILSQEYFKHKIYDKALLYAETSLGILIELNSHPENIAKALFNTANVAFQGDVDEKAEFYFSKLIEFIKVNKKVRFETINYAYNYYGQFLVKVGRYNEAIDIYKELIEMIEALESEIDEQYQDDYYSTLTEFKYRVFKIYYDYLTDQEACEMALRETIDSLKKIKQLSEQDQYIVNAIYALRESKAN